MYQLSKGQKAQSFQNYKRGDPLDFCKSGLLQNIKNVEEGPFGDI